MIFVLSESAERTILGLRVRYLEVTRRRLLVKLLRERAELRMHQAEYGGMSRPRRRRPTAEAECIRVASWCFRIAERIENGR